MWLGDVPSPAPCAVLGPLPSTVCCAGCWVPSPAPCWVLEQWLSLGTMGAVPHQAMVAAALRCPRCPRLGAGCLHQCRVPRGTGPLSLARVLKLRDLLSPAIPTAHACQESHWLQREQRKMSTL